MWPSYASQTFFSSLFCKIHWNHTHKFKNFFTFYHCFLGLCLILISINEMLFPIKNITLNFSYSSPLVFFSYFILLFMLENPNLASEASMWSPDLQLQLKSSICRTFTFLFEFLTRLNKLILIFQALLY